MTMIRKSARLVLAVVVPGIGSVTMHRRSLIALLLAFLSGSMLRRP
jgi:hypothetical protein